MKKKADLSELLAEAGSTRKRAVQPAHAAAVPQTPQHKGREGTAPITVHHPREVRNQLKILAVKTERTVHDLTAEAFNDLFAKHGMPEIAPIEAKA
jgi:hypothetical protein